MADERKTVTVHCALPSGIVLHVDELVRDHPLAMPGQLMARRKTLTVVLRYGANEGIDAEFYNKWLEQNKDGPIVRSATVAAG